MKLRYSKLHGLPIRSADGYLLGRLADIEVRRRGDEAVAERLLIAANPVLLLAARLGRDIDTKAISAGDIAQVGEHEVRLRFSKEHYR